MRVGAEGAHRELHGVGLAEHDHAGADEPLGQGGRRRRHAVDPHLRAAGGDAAPEIDQIFQADGNAVQRADAVAALDGPVGGLGGQARLGFVYSDIGMERRIAARDAREQRVHHVHR